MLAGANIIYGLGMLEMGMTISYSQLLMDAEMAERNRYKKFPAGRYSCSEVLICKTRKTASAAL